MQINCDEERIWFYSRQIAFKRTSALFAGLGSLLIDGDALISLAPRIVQDSYATVHDQTQLTLAQNVRLFLDKLKSAGFDRIKVVFFHSHSKWTQESSNDSLALISEAAQLFSDQDDVTIFVDWRENTEWQSFVVNEHASLILTTESNVYRQEDSQFSFIYDACHVSKVQVALLDHAIVDLSSFQSFVIDPLSSINISHNSDQSNDHLQNNEIPVSARILWGSNGNLDKSLAIHSIRNEKLRTLLGLSGLEPKRARRNKPSSKEIEVVEDSWETLADKVEHVEDEEPENETESYESTISISEYSYDNFTWDKGLSRKTQTEWQNLSAENRTVTKQKYYRFMEIYATSLDSSKNLHHKIMVKQVSKLPRQEKLSKKALEIIKNNGQANQAKEEELGNKFIEKLDQSIKCFDDIDKGLRDIDLNRFKPKFFANLVKLRIKWMKNEPSSYSGRKESLFLLVNELFDDFAAFLTKEEALKFLELMQKIGFGCTADHLCKAFNVSKDKKFKENIELKGSSSDTKEQEILFQLSHLGDKLKRTLNSKADERVKFKPDLWQRQLLDIVDKRESAVVCCPTSSGKTFISYYAMEQSLRNDDSDMVVFVSPYEALANQVAAEVYARFSSKTYPSNSSMSVYAMFMPEYQINDHENCQILITMPNSLETLLSEKTDVVKKIKYIILDEIHMLSDWGSGRSLEKIIHFAQCPIIALSATIGNLDPFYDWIKATSDSKGIRTHKVVHTERFCDLKKHIFVPKNLVDKQASQNNHPEPILNFDMINELFGYSEPYLRSFELSKEFHLLPNEIMEVLNALKRLARNQTQKELVESVQPGKFFNSVIINKRDVKNYETHLMSSMREWYRLGHFNKEEIHEFFNLINRKCEKIFELVDNEYGNEFSPSKWAADNIVELVETLQKNQLLPAIMFFKSSEQCDAMAAKLLDTLVEREERETRGMQLDPFEMQRIEKEKKRLKKQFELATRTLEEKDKWVEESRLNEQLDSMTIDKGFIDDKYTYLDPKLKVSREEIEELADRVPEKPYRSRIIKQWKRGIGVHHPDVHKRCNQITEMLCRKKHLQIVFATETLACGINMPCKTVILSHEVVNYDSVIYRHTIGRAGRRGFDTIGNVVFYGIPKQKIQNFISSKTSNIAGVSLFDPRFIMQMSVMNTYNLKTFDFFNSIINNPIVKLDMPSYDQEFAKEMMRLQVNYLINQGSIDAEFNPDKSVDLVLPLRHQDFAVEVVRELVRDQFFENLTEYKARDLENLSKKIILVLSHLIKVKLILPTQSELIESSGAYKSNIILPRVPELESYMEAKRELIDSYLKQNFTASSAFNDHVLMLRRSFPIYMTRVKQPKNSCIYDFYLNSDLKEIAKFNHQSITDFWYSIEATKQTIMVLATYYEQRGNEFIQSAFKACYTRLRELQGLFD